MITRKQVQAGLRLVTPPLIIEIYKRSPLHSPVRQFFNKPVGNEAPTWHTLSSGELRGCKVFSNTTGGFGEMINGSYDKFFFDYVKQIDLRGKAVLDVGSHVGFNTLYFAKLVGPGGKVIAFEPNTFNLKRLKLNLSGNPDLEERVTILDLALSDKKSTEDFLFSDNVDGGTSSGSFISSSHPIWQKAVYEEQIGFKRQSVATTSLDLWSTETSTRLIPALIKIDVEGAEYLVLEGGKQLISRAQPILLIELHSIFNMFRVGQTLQELGYQSQLLKEEVDGRCFIAATPKGKIQPWTH